MSKTSLTLIAGPCSVDKGNLAEIYQIAKIKVKGKRAIAGTRVVGLKSRTAFDPTGKGVGMDFKAFLANRKILRQGGTSKNFQALPSVKLAEKICADTNLLIATEIMDPVTQLPAFDGKFKGKLIPWSPAVNQLGWPLLEMATYAKKNHWSIGIKNGKWLGESLNRAESTKFKGQTSLEATWAGLASYVQGAGAEPILIHRGVDVPDKGDYRNAPIHHTASRTKLATGAKLFFDPSHSYGPKMRGSIVQATIDAMKAKLADGSFVYDGILIEAGTSQTDTEQHISLKELSHLVNQLAQFRSLVSPA